MQKSQNQAIREYLEAGHSITPLEVLNKFNWEGIIIKEGRHV